MATTSIVTNPPANPLRFIPLNEYGRQFLAEHAELNLIKAYKHGDDLKADLDKLAIQFEALLRERASIIETLRTFYREPLSASSVQPLLDLATRLDPSLALPEQRILRDVEDRS